MRIRFGSVLLVILLGFGCLNSKGSNSAQDSIPKDSLSQRDTNAILSRPNIMDKDMAQGSGIKLSPLPIGIRNPRFLDLLTLHSFSENWMKKQLSDKKAGLWYSAEGVHTYSEILIKELKSSSASSLHGNERKIRASWILFFLLVIILILTFIKLQFPNDLRTLQDSLFNDRLIRDDRELRFLRSPSAVLTLIAFCLSFSLLIYFYFRDQNIQLAYQGIELYGVLSIGLLLFFVLKILVLWLTGKIFNLVRVIQSYLSLNYIAMANFTIVLCPFLLVYALIKSIDIHYLAVWVPFLIVIFFLFLYIRSIIFVIINYRFSKFYLFLYFCAVEICPLLLVFKVIYT